MSRTASRAGFTLVELMVVIVIIAILAAMAIPKYNQLRNSAKGAQTASNLRQIQGALSSFSVDNNGLYPFRIRYYNPQTVAAPNFNPADLTLFPPLIHSEPDRPLLSLGLFGGVEVVNSDFTDNTQPVNQNDLYKGINKHKIIQPYGWTYNNFYRYFNQYSDPLVAMEYMGAYPQNPFLKRPMGSIMWGYGNAQDNGGPNQIDKTIPAPQVVPTPGDFVYTFFYHIDNGNVVPPPSVVPAKKSYGVKNDPNGGVYYIDMVDGYQLWAYGNLPQNGATYVAYPNNIDGLSSLHNQSAKKDWDNSGSRDMFEIGLCAYFKGTGSSASQSQGGGTNMEF